MVGWFKSFLGRARAYLAFWRGEITETVIAVAAFRVEIVTLHGLMRGSDETITLLYVGRGLNLPHFKKKFFVEAKTLHSQRSNLLSFRKAMIAEEARTDVIFLDIGWPYSKRINKKHEYLEVPDWICMTLSLEETWDATVQNFRKTMRKNIGRLIRKNNYHCVPTNDPVVVERFFDDFYSAFIKSRHADETHLTPRAIIEQRAREGIILQVIGDDGPVAAGVYFPDGDILRLLVTGMPEVYLDNPPVAAMQALYYFSVQYAFENGFKSINFMGTRAFPTNGLFQFKRKWGAGVEDTFSVDSFLFKPADNNLRAAVFCELFPMVSRNAGSLQLLVGAIGDTFCEADYEKILSGYHCEGFSDVKVVHLTDQPSNEAQLPSMSEANVRVKSCDLEHFAQNYIEN